MQKLQEAEKVAWRIIGDPQECEEKWLPAATLLSDKTDKLSRKPLPPWLKFLSACFLSTLGAMGMIWLAILCAFTGLDAIGASADGANEINGGPILLGTIPIGFSMIFGWIKGLVGAGSGWTRFNTWGTMLLQGIMLLFGTLANDTTDTAVWFGMYLMLFMSYPLFTVGETLTKWVKQHTRKLTSFAALVGSFALAGVWVSYVAWCCFTDGKSSSPGELITYSTPTITAGLIAYAVFIACWGGLFATMCKSKRWQTRLAFAAVSTFPAYGLIISLMLVGLVHLIVPGISIAMPLLLMSAVLLPTTMLGTAVGGLLGSIKR